MLRIESANKLWVLRTTSAIFSHTWHHRHWSRATRWANRLKKNLKKHINYQQKSITIVVHDWLHFGTKPKSTETLRHRDHTKQSKCVMLSRICTTRSACTHPNALVISNHFCLCGSLSLCLSVSTFHSLPVLLSGHTHTNAYQMHTRCSLHRFSYCCNSHKSRNKENWK